MKEKWISLKEKWISLKEKWIILKEKGYKAKMRMTKKCIASVLGSI